MKKKLVFTALLASTALALSACASGAGTGAKDGGSGETTKVVGADYLHAKYEELKQGGTLTLATVEVPPQMNPFHMDGTSYTSSLWKYFNPQLALFDDEGNWQFNPAYFDDVTDETVDGNTVVTFKLKDEATFNDGTPIDYRAFQLTWQQNNGTDEAYEPSSTDGYSQIKSVEKGASDKEVVVTFDGIYAWWQGLFNFVIHPSIDTPEKYASFYTTGDKDAWNNLGAGPYIIDSWDATGNTITFAPNPKWWGNKAKLDKITYKVMEDQAEMNAFSNGEIDVISFGEAERAKRVKQMEGISTYTAMRPASALMMLNADHTQLKDPQVRKAIFEAVDRTVISKVVFQGLDYTEQPPGSFTLFPSQPGYEDNFSKAVTYSPEESQKTLEAAGYKKGEDGYYAKNGKKLSLNFPLLGDSNTVKATANALQQMLKKVGVEMKINTRPSSDFSKVYTEKDFDIFTMGFSSTDPFGVAYFGQIYASDSGLNLSSTGTKAFDKKIAKLKKIADPEKQIAEANKLEVEAFKLYGIMPLYNGPSMVATKKGLANMGAMGFAVQPVENIGWTE